MDRYCDFAFKMVKIMPFYVLVSLIFESESVIPVGRLARWLVGFAALWLVAFDPHLSQNPSHWKSDDFTTNRYFFLSNLLYTQRRTWKIVILHLKWWKLSHFSLG